MTVGTFRSGLRFLQTTILHQFEGEGHVMYLNERLTISHTIFQNSPFLSHTHTQAVIRELLSNNNTLTICSIHVSLRVSPALVLSRADSQQSTAAVSPSQLGKHR